MIFRKGLALLLSFTVFLSSCGPDVSPTALKNIIGKDDRQIIEDSSPQTLDFPVLPLVHRTVDPKNKETTKDQFICNVTVIDPSFAITPFHCLEPMIDEQLKAGQTSPYSPDYFIQSHLNRYHEFQVFDVLEDLDLVLLSVLEPIRNKSIYEMGSFQDGEKLSIFSVLSDFINARNVLILSPRDLETDKTAGGPILATPPVDDPRADISVIGLEEISTPIRFWSLASLRPNPSLDARDGGIVCGEHGSCSPIHPEQYPDFNQDDLVGNRYVSDLIYRFQETSRVIRDKFDVLVYDLDTVRGASGSPLLQNGRIVGIHLGYDPKIQRNVGISLDAIYSRYSEERLARLKPIETEFKIGGTIGKLTEKAKDWVEDLSKDPVDTIAGTAKDLDPTNPKSSARKTFKNLDEAVKDLDPFNRNSSFRQALGRIDPDQKIGKFLKEHESELKIIAIVAAVAAGGYLLAVYGGVNFSLAVAIQTSSGTVTTTIIGVEGTSVLAGIGAGALAHKHESQKDQDESQINTSINGDQPGSPDFQPPKGNKGSGSGQKTADQTHGSRGQGRPSSNTTTAPRDEIKVKGPVDLVLGRLVELFNQHPGLIADSDVSPDLMSFVNRAFDTGTFDVEGAKLLVDFLDGLSQKVAVSHPQLSQEIDVIADGLNQKYVRGEKQLSFSTFRKLTDQQLRDELNRALREGDAFFAARLENNQDRSLRVAAVKGLNLALSTLNDSNVFAALQKTRYGTRRFLSTLKLGSQIIFDLGTDAFLVSSLPKALLKMGLGYDPLTGEALAPMDYAWIMGDALFGVAFDLVSLRGITKYFQASEGFHDIGVHTGYIVEAGIDLGIKQGSEWREILDVLDETLPCRMVEVRDRGWFEELMRVPLWFVEGTAYASGKKPCSSTVAKETVDRFKESAKKSAKEFEASISKLPSGERVAYVRGVARVKATQNGWTKNNKLSKKNNGRDIFTDKDGNHWSVDTQHGHFEKLNKKGKHQGAFDIDGNQVKPVDSSGRHDIII